jgi:hypothetical protein
LGKNGKTKNTQNLPNRADWEANHIIIFDAYIQAFNSKERPPTQTEIAKLTGLNRRTVADHLKQSSLSEMVPMLRPQTLLVLQGLANKAREGHAAEVKLWMQIVENWKEITGIEHSGGIEIKDARERLAERISRIAAGKEATANN